MNLQQMAKVLLAVLCTLVISDGAPVTSDKLQFKKNGTKEPCDWGCSTDIDKNLEICEAVCHLDAQNSVKQYGDEQQCQSVCASKYIRCFEECNKTVNTKAAPT